MAKLLKIEITS